MYRRRRCAHLLYEISIHAPREDIKALDKNLNDLKADLPLIYVTREDYIRVMNRVEDKLDQILYGGKAKGKEE